jgi:hypothetical protein
MMRCATSSVSKMVCFGPFLFLELAATPFWPAVAARGTGVVWVKGRFQARRDVLLCWYLRTVPDYLALALF